MCSLELFLYSKAGDTRSQLVTDLVKSLNAESVTSPAVLGTAFSSLNDIVEFCSQYSLNQECEIFLNEVVDICRGASNGMAFYFL